jgi:hypothetical protein
MKFIRKLIRAFKKNKSTKMIKVERVGIVKPGESLICDQVFITTSSGFSDDYIFLVEGHVEIGLLFVDGTNTNESLDAAIMLCDNATGWIDEAVVMGDFKEKIEIV